MRLAIIGGGFGVSGHLPAFMNLPEVNVVVVSDAGSGRAKASLPIGVEYAASWQEALSRPVDAVSIVVPPRHHLEIVSSALAQNKHVFCDKPFGVSLREAEMMVENASANVECVTAINFQFRFEPGIQQLKGLIESGVLGDLHAVHFSWLTGGRASPKSLWTWRNDALSGGGVIGAFFSHVADLIWWLTDREPLSVTGYSKIMVPHRPTSSGKICKVTAEDFVSGAMLCDDDLHASFRVSNCQTGGNGMVIEVCGSDGMLVYKHEPPFDLDSQHLTFTCATGSRELSISNPQFNERSPDTRVRAIQEAANQFTKKIAGDLYSNVPTFYDGLRVHKVMDGLRQSIKSGKQVSF